MRKYFRERPLAVLLASALTLAVLVFNMILAHQATSTVALVDGWAVLNRLRLFENGEISLGNYLFSPHGAHLHLAAYAPAWLDFHYVGGQQRVTQALSLAATCIFCCFFVCILIREGVRNNVSALVMAFGCAAAVALLSGLADEETMLHPFQAVLSLARLSYALLLFALIRALLNNRPGLYLVAMGCALLAVTFHGTGYVFAICVIIVHALICRRAWMVAVSVLPLLVAVAVQRYYSEGGGELANLGAALSMRTVVAIVPALSAYFVSPVWVLEAVVGVNVLLAFGFVIFCITTWLTLAALRSVLGIRSLKPRRMWHAMLAARVDHAPDIVTVFLAVMGVFLLASGVAATLFWIVRTVAATDQVPLYHYVLYSRRYGAFACLSYVIVIVALFRAVRNSGGHRMAGLAAPFTLVLTTLLLAAALYSSILDLRTYDLDNKLNIAAAGIALGLSPIQPEVDKVWEGAAQDAYWVTELPKTAKFVRALKKGIWHDLPEVGARGGAFYAAYPIGNLKRQPIASDTAPGRCAFSGNIPVGTSEFGTAGLVLPVANSEGVVVGFAAHLRVNAERAPHAVSGFVQCAGGTADMTPLFLAHDITPLPAIVRGVAARGSGLRPIAPITDVKGSLVCAREAGNGTLAGNTVILTLTNASGFDWRLDEGQFPVRLGVHLLNGSGGFARWDDGFRVPTEDVVVPSHGSATLRFPLGKLSLAGAGPDGALTAQFALVQDRNAWFSNISCNIALSP